MSSDRVYFDPDVIYSKFESGESGEKKHRIKMQYCIDWLNRLYN